MKTPLSVFLLVQALTSGLPIARAAELTWDVSSDPGIQGGAGSWNTASPNWTGDGGASRIAWSGADHSAVFAAGSGVVAVDGEIELAALKVTSPASSTIGGRSVGYLFNGGALRFGDRKGLIDTETAQTTLQINSRLTGTGGLLVRSGGGDTGSASWTVLAGDNSGLTGGISIESGLVGLARPEAVGANAITLAGNGGIFAPVTHSGTGSGGAVNPAAELRIGNDIRLDGPDGRFRVWGNRSLILEGAITGEGSLRKTGEGVLSIEGDARYAGDTRVEAGTLSLANPTLADAAAVYLSTGATLDLPHGEADAISLLYVDGAIQPKGTYHSGNSPLITGGGRLAVAGPLTYDEWLASFGLTPGAPGTGPGESADGSGVENAIQFALGGDPTNPADDGIQKTFLEDAAGNGNFVLTIAVPAGVKFSSAPHPSATIDGIPFSIQGSADLADWLLPVEEIAVQDRGSLVAPPGYGLKSFRLVQSPPLGSRGFLRLRAWTPPAVRPNVLFIAVDDLRPWLGSYDPAFAVSPNIDRLAAGGRVFTRGYANAATCGASRCALLFGRYPGRLAGDDNNDAIRLTAAIQPVPSLPALFRNQGYWTVSVGKITHYPGGRSGAGWAAGTEELPGAWDAASMPSGPWNNPQRAMHGYAGGVARQDAGNDSSRKPVTQFSAGGDKTYPDGWIAEEAVFRLQEAAAGEAPFFLAVGFIKPHLPFVAPESYLEAVEGFVPLVPPAAQAPSFPSTWHNSTEFRQYGFNEGDPFGSPAAAQAYRKAYLACIRYSDAQVGKLLAALEASPAADNTIVVLWGDHGFLLGEHAIWGKHCLFEEALRVPMIIRAPGNPFPGEKSGEIVETVDLYPTLATLAGLPLPAGLDGESLAPQLEHPGAPSKGVSLGVWGDHVSLRTSSHRFIQRLNGGANVELYDHRVDPAETLNTAAGQPDAVGAFRRRVQQLLAK